MPDQLEAIYVAANERREKEELQALEEAKKAAKDNYYKTTLGYGLGLAGNVAGIMIAVKRKSGFWGGVGWFLVVGLAGSAAGYVVGSIIDGKPKD